MTKGIKKPNDPNREKVYRDWRMNLGYGACTDIDQVEWYYTTPVAVLEITRVNMSEDGLLPSDAFFDAILKRYNDEKQGKRAEAVAERLGCPAYIVVFQENLEHFWVYRLKEKRNWWHMNQAKYIEFLHWIRVPYKSLKSTTQETPMNDERTKTALEESIAHWERMAAFDSVAAIQDATETVDSSDCALCTEFAYEYPACTRCPVRLKTGKNYCHDSPYYPAAHVFVQITDGFSVDVELWQKAAQAEVEFLKSLRSS